MLQRNLNDFLHTRLFSLREILLLAAIFIAAIIGLNVIVRSINRYVVSFDCPHYWPLSIFNPRIPDWQNVLVAVAVFIVFIISLKYLPRTKFKISFVIVTAIILVLGTNLIQGWMAGYANPIAGSAQSPVSDQGIQYYHDAIKIGDPLYFMDNYELLQPDLLTHSRVHPPGAVLTVYFLNSLFKSPAPITFSIAIISTLLSVIFMYGILKRELEDAYLAGYAAFLFALIPSVQIYYAASVDALIASLLLGVLAFFTSKRKTVAIGLSSVFLLAASFLSFSFAIILPVIVVYELVVRRSLLRSASVIMILALVYFVFYIVFNYNYLHSFFIASALENPQGFSLLAVPASYFFTRLEGILEIIVFFGPFLSLLFFYGFRLLKKQNTGLYTIVVTALISLLAMFAAGMFRTGETARACLFIYPYLLIPVVLYLRSIDINVKETQVLSFLVFGQAILMQMFGFYFW
jgi:hypothetical protein